MIRQQDSRVELYLGRRDEAENARIFNELEQHKAVIETAFGDGLQWEPLQEKRACRIRKDIQLDGYRSPADQWPRIHEAMIDAVMRLEKALGPRLAQIREGVVAG